MSKRKKCDKAMLEDKENVYPSQNSKRVRTKSDSEMKEKKGLSIGGGNQMKNAGNQMKNITFKKPVPKVAKAPFTIYRDSTKRSRSFIRANCVYKNTCKKEMKETVKRNGSQEISVDTKELEKEEENFVSHPVISCR